MSNPDHTAGRILVVEDEPAIGAMCRSILTAEGFEVDIAPNGRMAQGMIEENEYHLCLLDMLMPRMDGQEFYEWLLEKHPQMADLVVFTTGSVIDADIRAFIEKSGRRFLPKPFLPDELREIVRDVLGQTEEA